VADKFPPGCRQLFGERFHFGEKALSRLGHIFDRNGQAGGELAGDHAVETVIGQRPSAADEINPHRPRPALPGTDLDKTDLARSGNVSTAAGAAVRSRHGHQTDIVVILGRAFAQRKPVQIPGSHHLAPDRQIGEYDRIGRFFHGRDLLSRKSVQRNVNINCLRTQMETDILRPEQVVERADRTCSPLCCCI
jgi:hypothetical protein